MNTSSFKVNWVLVEELALGPSPKNKDNLKMLHSYGIKNVVSLCEPNELELITELEKQFNFISYPLPDHRYKIKPKLKDINNILDCIKENNHFGPTYVHCFAGIERSPLVCISWLIRECSFDLETSLQYIMKINPRTCPLDYQLDVLKKI